MNIIDKDGVLVLDRKGILKKQKCPWYSQRSIHSKSIYCDDECPLFEEGIEDDVYLNCGGRLVTYKVEDQREKKEDQ